MTYETPIKNGAVGPSEKDLIEAQEALEDFDAGGDFLGLYLGEVRQFPLLSEEDEVQLAQRIKEGVVFSGEVSDLKLVSATAEGQWALDLLISSNLRLSIWQAKKHIGRGVLFEDLIQRYLVGKTSAGAGYFKQPGDPDTSSCRRKVAED
jgi:RNA polymerase primary sigma factor